MRNRIKYVLCNENGGPNLENLLGIAIALAIAACIVKLAGSTKTLGTTTIGRMGAMDDYFG